MSQVPIRKPAKRALRTAVLDPSDCDEPGSGRRIALATYADYDDFVYRLPKFIADVSRGLEDRIQQAEGVDRFWRAADAPAGGTGLGLPIARWIADRHGGQLIAENRAQGGACLRFSMPGA